MKKTISIIFVVLLFSIVFISSTYSAPSFNTTDWIATGATNKTQTTFYFNVTWKNQTGYGMSWHIAQNQTSTWTNSTINSTWFNKGNNWWVAVSSFLITAVRGITFSIIGYANDSTGWNNTNQTGYGFLVNVTVLNTAPTTPTIIYPVDGKYYTDIPYINYTSYDADGDILTYKVDINDSVNITTTVNVTDWNASDGYYKLQIEAYDNIDPNVLSSIIFFALDNTPPTYSNFTNNNSQPVRGDVVNWSIFFADNINLSGYKFAHNQSGTLTNGTYKALTGGQTFANETITITSAAKMNVVGQYWVNDTSNNVNQTVLSESGANLTITNIVPTTPTITYPVNGKNYTDIPYINYSSTDADGDALTYKIYINGTLNISTTVNVTDWNASDGYYNLTVSVWDGYDSSANSTYIKFALDATPPNVNITYPVNNSNISSNAITINATASDNIAPSLTYYWFINGTLNSTSLNSNSTFNASDGYYNLTLFVSDSLQNGTNTSLFTLDTTAPSITNLNNKTIDDGTDIFYTNDNIYFNATIIDTTLTKHTITLSWNDTSNIWHNETPSNIGNVYYWVINTTNISIANNKWLAWRYYANDSAGNMQIGSIVHYFVSNLPSELEPIAGAGGGSEGARGGGCDVYADAYKTCYYINENNECTVGCLDGYVCNDIYRCIAEENKPISQVYQKRNDADRFFNYLYLRYLKPFITRYFFGSLILFSILLIIISSSTYLIFKKKDGNVKV